jgi:hypothetical protein
MGKFQEHAMNTADRMGAYKAIAKRIAADTVRKLDETEAGSFEETKERFE